jgi:hypothetical protein
MAAQHRAAAHSGVAGLHASFPLWVTFGKSKGRRERRLSSLKRTSLPHEINSRTLFASSWHHEIIAAKLEAVREGRIRRLIINVPPRHLKSHLASVAFPAWWLGHEPGLEIVCASYAQDLADKLSRDCRHGLL